MDWRRKLAHNNPVFDLKIFLRQNQEEDLAILTKRTQVYERAKQENPMR